VDFLVFQNGSPVLTGGCKRSKKSTFDEKIFYIIVYYLNKAIGNSPNSRLVRNWEFLALKKISLEGITPLYER
jgi:hypothetical protein